ncbi:MAG: response regulator transcription factor [Myxococcales bacterium]|nr:response regulator transcription factor [Myxococcales bacterium]
MAGLILVVEDEPDLLATLDYNLEREGYHTRLAASGREALDFAALEPMPELILLDLMLPDLSGTEVCRRLKNDPKTRDIPVIMVTARGHEIDRVVGFEVGADDYVVKPYSVRELLLRIRAVLRRTQDAEVERQGAATRVGMLRIDVTAHRAWVNEDEVTLTALEFKLLQVLLRRRGRVQSREQLLNDVWGITADVTTRTVDTHVKRLRQKLGDAGSYVETLRGVGYRFTDTPLGAV